MPPLLGLLLVNLLFKVHIPKLEMLTSFVSRKYIIHLSNSAICFYYICTVLHSKTNFKFFLGLTNTDLPNVLQK